MTNDVGDSIVLGVIMAVLIMAAIYFIVKAITQEQTKENIYRVIYKDNDGAWRTHKAGLTFLEAKNECDFLLGIHNCEKFSIVIDTFAS